MRLVSYESPWSRRAGILVDGCVVDTEWIARTTGLATEGDRRFTSNRRVLQIEADLRARLEDLARDAAAAGPGAPGVYGLDDVTLGPPVPNPGKIICAALNYRDHIDEYVDTSGMDVPESLPGLFPKYSTALVGPTAEIVIPEATSQVDYEGELAVVIGRTCKEVAAADAVDYVAGAMVFNDVSARDMQIATGQLLNAKALDTFAPCGPALVLMDEIDDLQSLQLTTRINGDMVQSASTALMIYSVAALIEYVSSLLTLHPGDIIATGTPSGVGASSQPPRFLAPGDVIQVTIDGLGSISNPVVSGQVVVPPSDFSPDGTELLAGELRADLRQA